jgi:small-conductance mechanosensitive channel
MNAALFVADSAAGTLQPIVETAQAFWHGLLARVPHIVSALLVIAIGIGLSRPVSRAVCRVGARGRHENLGEVLARLVRAVLIFMTFLVAAVITFPTFRPGDLITGLGITSVAIGFAFKDILQNFFAGILILWRQPFRVGDEIRSGEFEGVVEDINTRSTRIRTYDGEQAVLPNGDVYTRAILVRTAYDKRRVRFTVGIGYPDSIEEAREVIHSVLASTEGVLRDPGPWVYVSELAPSSVNFTVYFWVEPQQRNVLRVGDRAATGIKLALDSAGIDMPYPHSVILFHDQTGSRERDRNELRSVDAGQQRPAPGERTSVSR